MAADDKMGERQGGWRVGSHGGREGRLYLRQRGLRPMNVTETIARFRKLDTVRRSPPMRPSDADRLVSVYPWLPRAHVELLRLANGITAFDGYWRLFGFGMTEATDLERWNAHDTWKFAYADRNLS